jgi:hypothetical protein
LPAGLQATVEKNKNILEMLERHVVEDEARVTRQMLIVAMLEQGSRPELVIIARNILTSLERSVAFSAAHLARQRAQI